MLTFETARLRVEPWRLSLADEDRRKALVCGLPALLTPEVLEHLPPHFAPELGPDAEERWITARDAEGHVCTIHLAHSHELIGLLLLWPEGNEARIGCMFTQSTWGKGIASEMLSGLVDAAQSAGIGRLVAGATTSNKGSIRVLEKAGFVISDSEYETATFLRELA